MGYAPYSTGNNNNTYQGVFVVDKNGKEVKYANGLGELVDYEEGIFQPPEEGSFIIGHGIALDHGQKGKYKVTLTDPGLWKKVLAGEYEMPFYVDWTRMSEKSRNIVWKLMLSHEGKCRVPIYKNFSDWGFDPDQDMLQYPINDYSNVPLDTPWIGYNNTPPNWRSAGGGYLTDWRLQTSLPGLFGAGGGPLPSSGCHGESQTTGRYAGRQAAWFAGQNGRVEPDAAQIAREKERVYAPINANGDVGWKELNYAVARIMQDYGGTYKTEHTLDMGIRRMKDLLGTEGQRMYAANPHELARAIESVSLAEKGIAHLEAMKARKASCKVLGFYRNDCPDETEEWHAWVAVSQDDGGAVKSRKVPVDFYLQEPYSPDLEENYRRFAEV
jgi:hypothetical protein